MPAGLSAKEAPRQPPRSAAEEGAPQRTDSAPPPVNAAADRGATDRPLRLIQRIGGLIGFVGRPQLRVYELAETEGCRVRPLRARPS
jgi:hypothetical protein